MLQGATCSGTGGDDGQGATAALSRSDSNQDVAAGESIQLAWSSSGAAVCQATTGGAATTWNGLRSASGSESIVIPAAGTYAFSLACYALAGGQSKAVNVTATGTPPPSPEANACVPPVDPLYQPAGWTRVQKTWIQAFSAPDGDPLSPGYPRAVAFPTPIGAQKGTYVTIAFQPNANESVLLYFDQIQSGGLEPWPVRPAEAMFFAISPCPGDLRATVYGSSADPFLQHGCRIFENSASLIFSTKIAQSDYSACKVEPGKTYYLHVMAANPADGLVPSEHSCLEVPTTANGCDVGIRSQVSH